MISLCVKGLMAAQDEEVQSKRTVNLLRSLSHLGIKVRTAPGTLVIDLRDRKDITFDDLKRIVLDAYARDNTAGLLAIWERLEAYWSAKGIPIHQGLRTEMLDKIAEIEDSD